MWHSGSTTHLHPARAVAIYNLCEILCRRREMHAARKLINYHFKNYLLQIKKYYFSIGGALSYFQFLTLAYYCARVEFESNSANRPTSFLTLPSKLVEKPFVLGTLFQVRLNGGCICMYKSLVKRVWGMRTEVYGLGVLLLKLDGWAWSRQVVWRQVRSSVLCHRL